MMGYYWYLALFAFGLTIGSFLNVISLRYQPGQKLLDKKIIGGRSHCPACYKKLAWYELIPIISFLVQLGKCRRCGRKLSLQYPFVEILSGLIFVFVPLTLINSDFYAALGGYQLLVIGCWLLVFLLFLLLSIIDFHHLVIPDKINLLLAILGIVLLIINYQLPITNYSFLSHYALLFDFWPPSILNNQWSIVVNHLFAAFLGVGFFGLIILLSRGRAMGWGDFKLVGALGLIFGWPDIIMVLFLSFIIGSLVSAPFLIIRKKKMKDVVPFGPFLVISASLTFFLGYQIIDCYFKIFGL